MCLQITFSRYAGGNEGFQFIYMGILEQLKIKYPNISIIWNNTDDLVASGNTVTASFGGVANLSIQNLNTNKCSILSFADIAEVHTYKNHGFDPYHIVEVFGGLRWGSNEFTAEDISAKFNFKHHPFPYPVPYADFSSYVQNNRIMYDPTTRIRKAFFAGMQHAERAALLQHMRHHPLIDVYDDSVFRHDYYQLMNKYAIAISLNGNGEWTIRDIECFGMGIPAIRSELKAILRHDPVIPDVHYIRGSVASGIAWMSYPEYTWKQIADQFIDRIEKVMYEDDFLISVSKAGLDYYEKYCSNVYIRDLFIKLFDPEILL